MSNNADWDIYTLGPVGVTTNTVSAFQTFVEEHGDFTRSQCSLVQNFDAILRELDDCQIDLIAEGTPKIMITVEGVYYIGVEMS
jgi:hypothetical protein